MDLHDENQVLEKVFLDAGDPIILETLDGRIVRMNSAAEQLYNFTTDELKGKEIKHLIPPEFHVQADQMLRRCLLGEVVRDEESVRLTRDGRAVQTLVTLSLINSTHGNASGVVSFAKDLTKVREAEAQASQMARVFKDGADPILIEDLRGVVVDMNDRAVEQYGYSRKELIGKMIKTIVPIDRHEQADELLQRCLAGEDVRDVEGVRVARSGLRQQVLISLSLLFGADGKPTAIATFAKDISALKEAEERLARYARELDRAARREWEFALLGESPVSVALRAQIKAYASRETTVFIVGPPGAGEEAVARSLHDQSSRSGGAFVSINCKHFEESAGETTLFGVNNKEGFSKLNVAEGGTLFLSRVENLSPTEQTKLAVVIQGMPDKGGVRVILHSSVDPFWAAEEGRLDRVLATVAGRFRFSIPSLSERIEDIPVLAEELIRKRAMLTGRRAAELTEESLGRLMAHTWPGNILELKGIIDRAVELSTGEMVEVPAGLLTAGIPVGGYHLTKKIGEGGMGEVWLAEHDILMRPAAVKLIRPSAASEDEREALLTRFGREAQATASLRSPHTIELYDYGTKDDGSLFYVMEYLQGMDASDMVEQFGRIPPSRAICFLIQATHSLEEAHSQGLVHRDIKPSNIFITNLGTIFDFVKILDFGIVKISASTQNMTSTNLLLGTPGYIAPELLHDGATEATPAADIYALGCVGYYMLSGNSPFSGMDAFTLITRQSSEKPPRISERFGYPTALVELVFRMMSVNPSERPANMRELRRDLESIQLDGNWTNEDAAYWWAKYHPKSTTLPPEAVAKTVLSRAEDTLSTTIQHSSEK